MNSEDRITGFNFCVPLVGDCFYRRERRGILSYVHNSMDRWNPEDPEQIGTLLFYDALGDVSL